MAHRTNDRRARLHAALDSVLGQVEQAVKRASPSVAGAVTTEPSSIGRSDDSFDWIDREAENISRKAESSGRRDDHQTAARVCNYAANTLRREGERERAEHFSELAQRHLRKSYSEDRAKDAASRLQRAYDVAHRS